MKVAINGLIICNENAGIGRYGYSLLNSLLKANGVDYTLFLQDNVKIECNKIFKRKSYKGSYGRILDEQLILPFLYKQFDLVHFIDYSSPYFKVNVPYITTIHDLAYYKYPETFSYGSLKIKQILAPVSMERSSVIVTDSENTCRDIVELFPRMKEKIRVVYPGCSGFKAVTDKNRIEEVKRKYGIGSEYIISVGTLEPRKNFRRLLMAYQLVNNQFKDINMVIVGKRGWLYKEFFDILNKSELKDSIIFTEYIQDEDLVSLYSGARCFVYPSLYEGFGLPPLEAMSCGTPVVVSNTASLPEVVGDAGLYVNPVDVESIANGIIQIINNNSLSKQIIVKGYEQAAKFTWEKAASQIVDIYQEILD